ncbi:MAG: Gfo/Idh/MocA family protein [bacterium]
MKPVKLGIIGCGIAARDLHWPALKKLTNKFEITVVCNHTEPKAKEFSNMIGGVPYVLDYAELLSRTDVEAVDIVLPIHLNYQVTKDALQAGKHVMVEKPLAANLTDAKSMVEFESHYPQVKMVAENFRYHDTFHRLKTYLVEGIIGEPYVIFWDVFYHINPNTNKYAQTKWRIHHQYPGGFITDAGIHNIAVLRDMFGDMVSVNAFTKSINRKIGEIDAMSLQFVAANSIHGVFNIFVSVNGFQENRLLILGTHGSALVKDNEKIVINKNNKIELEETIITDNGYVGEFEAFYQAIRNGQKVVSSFTEAYLDLQVMLRALESTKNQQNIKLD